MTTLGGPPVLLLNRGLGANHWLSIMLRGTRSNRDGYGARVQVNGQTRFATSAGSYVCASDKRLHFGLGSAAKKRPSKFCGLRPNASAKRCPRRSVSGSARTGALMIVVVLVRVARRASGTLRRNATRTGRS